MSGQWPPEWEDQEEEFTEGTEQSDTPMLDEARLSEVTAYLASVPVTVMPDAVESRISAALAAEAATRAERPASAGDARTLGAAPARPRLRRRGTSGKGDGDRHRRGLRLKAQVLGGSLVACLLLVGLGFGLSYGNSSSSSSSAASGSAAATSAASSAASSAVGSGEAGVAGPAPHASSARTRYASDSGESFAVTASGTSYRQATLAEQVRGRLAATGPATSVGTVPGVALHGCVLRLTDGAPPRLVDRATYQGEPAYVIATSTRAWVVGLGCTSAKADLIVSVALAGLPGNLRALVSVEQ